MKSYAYYCFHRNHDKYKQQNSLSFTDKLINLRTLPPANYPTFAEITQTSTIETLSKGDDNFIIFMTHKNIIHQTISWPNINTNILSMQINQCPHTTFSGRQTNCI